jgi:hypothetical protein
MVVNQKFFKTSTGKNIISTEAGRKYFINFYSEGGNFDYNIAHVYEEPELFYNLLLSGASFYTPKISFIDEIVGIIRNALVNHSLTTSELKRLYRKNNERTIQ